MAKMILKSPFQDLSEGELSAVLIESDKLMARVFEDTLSALLKKGAILPRDLPDCAREVLETRAKLRGILEERRKY